jgi:hypothetical protein
MHIKKSALIAGLALLASGASAQAMEVTKRIQTPGEITAVWEIAGAFCSIKDWHPAVKQCEEVMEGEDKLRILTLQDGGKIKETDSSDESYSYGDGLKGIKQKALELVGGQTTGGGPGGTDAESE